jgi:hypothetical protein
MLARDMLKQIWWVVIALFCAAAPKRFAFNAFNRLIFASLYRVAPYVLNALVIGVRGHRVGFRLFWRWKYGPWLSRAVLVGLPGLSKRRLAIMFPSIAPIAPQFALGGLDDRDPVNREPRF